MDKRKTYYLVIDIESANSVDQALTYDIGFAVADKKGHIYESKSYVVSDIFFDEKKIYHNYELMNSSYYADKLPQYYDGIHNGLWSVCPLLLIRKEIHSLMKEYNITTVCAYNCSFDKNALNNSIRYISKSSLRWFFPYGTEFYCIWNMACQTICRQVGYRNFCLENGFYSDSHNMKTSAEVVWAYLTQNADFEESHTGLEDVKIEVQIMAHCFRQHKKMDKGINRLCWRTPQAEFKALLV
jgi:hypothetical protein